MQRTPGLSFAAKRGVSGAGSLIRAVRRHECAPMKRFAIGFLLALFACGLANALSYYVLTDAPGAADAIRRAGFPFLVWEEGGFAYRYHFSHAGSESLFPSV